MANINFLNTDNCTAVTFNTPTTDLQFVEYILNDPGKDYFNVGEYTITTSSNCCSPGVVTTVAPFYEFFPIILNCIPGGNETFTIELSGMHVDLISEFSVGIDGFPPAPHPYTDTLGIIEFDIDLDSTVDVHPIEIFIITTFGYEYTVTFDITQVAAAAIPCDSVVGVPTVTYPTLPVNIVEAVTALPDKELSVNDLFGFAGTDLPTGVYQVIICETLRDNTATCIQNYNFIDCSNSMKCQVVNKLVMCMDSNIMDFYTALGYANDCTEIVTYEEACALYEILTIILETDDCFGMIDDCNCTDASTLANKLSPVRYPSPIPNNNPCNSC